MAGVDQILKTVAQNLERSAPQLPWVSVRKDHVVRLLAVVRAAQAVERACARGTGRDEVLQAAMAELGHALEGEDGAGSH